MSSQGSNFVLMFTMLLRKFLIPVKTNYSNLLILFVSDCFHLLRAGVLLFSPLSKLKR